MQSEFRDKVVQPLIALIESEININMVLHPINEKKEKVVQSEGKFSAACK